MKNLNRTRTSNRLLSLESKFIKKDEDKRKSTSKGTGSFTGMLSTPTNDHWIADNGEIQTKVGLTAAGTQSKIHRFFTYQPELGTAYGLAATLTENAAGLVEFPATGTGFERYGSNDAGGTDDGVVHGPGDHWLKPITAAALFGLCNKVSRDYSFIVALGDMSSSNGSDPWEPGSIHHKGHGHGGNRIGVDIDFRYLNNSGRSFQSSNAFADASFSATNNQRFYDAAVTFGFTANYQGPSGSLNGITKVKGHDNHGHLGLTLASVNWVQQQAVGGLSIAKSIPDTALAFTTPQTWDRHTNTRIQQIHPNLRTTVANFINHMDRTFGMQLRVGDNPFRTFAEQDAEYARGRTAPGGIVTNARAGQSYHNYGLAVDVVEIHPHYGYGEGYDQTRWDTIGREAINAGFVWGGNFTTIVDKPHIEMSYGFTTAQLLTRYNNGNFLPGTRYLDLRPNLSTGNSWSDEMTYSDAYSDEGFHEQFSSDFPSVTSDKFRALLPTILRHEGGFVNDPDDPGGATNKGITIGTFERHAQNILGIEPTLQNLRALTDDQAGEIYEVVYWNGIKGEQISDVQVAYQFVDFYINAGPNAVKVMQRTLNSMGHRLEVDGGVGDLTLAAINAVNGEELFNKFKANRMMYYQRLVEQKPKMGKFLKTWTSRTNSFVYGSVGLSGSKSFGLDYLSQPMGYAYIDGMHRMDLSSNAGNRAHNRWIQKGADSSYVATFRTKLTERKKAAYNASQSNTDLFKANIYAVVDTLDVMNTRIYQPTDSSTYCNIYAYDVVTALGGYLPRLWWTDGVEKKMINGTLTADSIHPTLKKAYKNIYDGGVTLEQNANQLNAWLDRIGSTYFGWEKATDMAAAQTAANNGHIVIISAKNKVSSSSGHINIILPELPDSPAPKDGLPLQSQAGRTNFVASRSKSWWNDSNHENGHAWIYKGQITSPIIASGVALGGAYA